MVENPLGLVTVRHLLQHTAGGWPNKDGPSDPIKEKKKYNAAELISWVLTNSDYDLKDKPGMVTAYSNFGYILLGRIIEKTVAENVLRRREPLH
jgi:CubicO group peptidase (beta-lactamase class C family)